MGNTPAWPSEPLSTFNDDPLLDLECPICCPLVIGILFGLFSTICGLLTLTLLARPTIGAVSSSREYSDSEILSKRVDARFAATCDEDS